VYGDLQTEKFISSYWSNNRITNSTKQTSFWKANRFQTLKKSHHSPLTTIPELPLPRS